MSTSATAAASPAATATANTVSVTIGGQFNVTAVNGAQTSLTPALAPYDNLLYMAYLGWGASSSLYSCYFDGTTWQAQTNITDQMGAKSSASPALAAFNGKLYMAYMGSGSSNLYVCSFDGSVWGNQVKVTDQNDAKTGSAPALAAFNGKLYLAYRGWGASNSLYVCSSSDGASWGSQTNVTDQNGAETTSTAGPALAAYNGSLYMGYEAKSGSALGGADLYICSTSNGTSWGAQTDLADVNGAQCFNGCSLAVNGGLLFAIYHGAHTAAIYGCALNGSTWSTNQVDFSTISGVGSATGPALSAYQNQFYSAFSGTGVSTNLWEFPFTAQWNS
jgi:hypothetical protein